MGPCGVRSDDEDVEAEAEVLRLNAVIVCDTPSARMNCSRSSMFVRPLAVIVCNSGRRIGVIEKRRGFKVRVDGKVWRGARKINKTK